MGPETRDFLLYHFQRCEGGSLNFRFLRGEEKRNHFLPLDRLTEDSGELEDLLSRYKAFNCYFGAASRNGDNGTKAGILQIPALHGDLDGSPLPPVNDGPFPPSATVETSPGKYHVYWKLRKPADKSEIDKVEDLLRRLASHFKGDMNATDASRILRLPGTLNFKTDPPSPVKLIKMDGPEYNLSDFLDSDLPPVEKPSPGIAGGSKGEERVRKIMEECLFLQHCDRDRITLPEPEWYGMISILAREPGGREAIHGLSKGYLKYSSRETDAKILHSLGTPPITCAKIKTLWNCGRDCGVKSPAGLPFKKKILPPPSPPPENGFPREAIGGLAGDFANLYSHYLESPWTFFAMNFLTCLGSLLADRVTIQSELQPEPRLYTVNLGESADDRKSESMKKTVRFVETTLEAGAFKVCFGVGSAEGLAKRLEENPRLLLVFDELKAFVSKSQIEGAILLPCVTSLFEDSRFHSVTKSHSIDIEEARLSLLAASTVETFARMWTPAFLDIGFLNRLWLVKDHGERKYSIPREIPEYEIKPLRARLGELLRGLPMGKIRLPIEDEARTLFDEWYFSLERSVFAKRLDGYGLRFMILLAVNEGLSRISPEIVSKVVSLLKWQLEIRRELDPVDAEGTIAKLEEIVRRTVKGPTPKRDLQKRVHYERYGLFAWRTATENLIRAKEIRLDHKTQIFYPFG
jgi:hypothetical protein